MGKVRTYTVKPCTRKEISNFIELWHYSHNMNGIISDYCFGLYDGDALIGAMVYGKIAMANVWKRYVNKQEDIIELRRLCCIDNTPRNTESYFIGKTLKWLQKNTNIKMVISYADATYGHVGTIYKASNFKYLGMTKPGKVIRFNGQTFHDKAIRTKYKGKLKPFAEKLKSMLKLGVAYYLDTLGKHIYTYDLRQ